jgi:hypothetical protein
MQAEPGATSLQVTSRDDVRLIGPPGGVQGWTRMKLVSIRCDDKWKIALDIKCDDNQAHVSRYLPG